MRWFWQKKRETADDDPELDESERESADVDNSELFSRIEARLAAIETMVNRLDKRYYARKAQGNGQDDSELPVDDWHWMRQR